jgi:putative component of membrane protein insertase Oxa1/YidC/SpoIIIJ protein YidD
MKQLFSKIYERLKVAKHLFLISNFGVTSYCKHQPSCSHYTYQKIKQEGLLVGGLKGLKRILTCI